jgi:hypothetical protein
MQPPEQLGIFTHGLDVALRNDVIEALERRDGQQARLAWHKLREEFPHDPDMAPFEQLIGALEAPDAAALATHEAAAAERSHLAGDLSPCARAALGARADAWLRPCWASLARRSAGLPFTASQADDHAAAAWLRAECWREAAQAVESIESWRRIPRPMAWMLEAVCRRDGLDSAWPLLAELAWLSPSLLAGLLPRLGDPLLLRLHQRFAQDFEGSGAHADLAWFPAWLLIDSPSLAGRLSLAQASLHTAPERAMRLLLELLGLERAGRHHELMQQRRSLRDLQPALYRAYMATR